MAEENRRFLLAERPTGPVDDNTYDLVGEPVPEVGEGEALVRVKWISIDPTTHVPGSIRSSRERAMLALGGSPISSVVSAGSPLGRKKTTRKARGLCRESFFSARDRTRLES